MMTATLTFNPARILNKIRELRKSYNLQERKTHEVRVELSQSVYMFYEGCSIKGMVKRDITRELVTSVGSNMDSWTTLYRMGKALKTLRLDPKKITAGGLNLLSKVRCEKIPKEDKTILRNLLNKGASATDVQRKLRLLGISAMPGMSSGSRMAIRRNKRKWEDWTPEFASLLTSVRQTTDKKPPPKIEIVLRVNGRDELVVSNR